MANVVESLSEIGINDVDLTLCIQYLVYMLSNANKVAM